MRCRRPQESAESCFAHRESWVRVPSSHRTGPDRTGSDGPELTGQGQAHLALGLAGQMRRRAIRQRPTVISTSLPSDDSARQVRRTSPRREPYYRPPGRWRRTPDAAGASEVRRPRASSHSRSAPQRVRGWTGRAGWRRLEGVGDPTEIPQESHKRGCFWGSTTGATTL